MASSAKLFPRFFRSTLRSRREEGFTLTELLTVVTIAAILAAVAVPSFKTMSRNMAVRGAASELVADIQFARSEAARANQAVTLSLSRRTWQIFIDGNGDHVRDNSETLLREGIYSDLIAEQTTALWLEFSPIGVTTPGAGSFPTGICLSIAEDVQRQVWFQTRAASPVIQTSCR